MLEQAGPQLQCIAVVVRFFPSFVVTGIMGASGVKGAVARPKTKVCERFMKSCDGVFAECFLGEALSECIVEVAQVLEAAGAFETFKIGGTFWPAMGGMKVALLEKSSAGFHFDEGSFISLLEPSFIVDGMARSLFFGLVEEIMQGSNGVEARFAVLEWEVVHLFFFEGI